MARKVWTILIFLGLSLLSICAVLSYPWLHLANVPPATVLRDDIFVPVVFQTNNSAAVHHQGGNDGGGHVSASGSNGSTSSGTASLLAPVSSNVQLPSSTVGASLELAHAAMHYLTTNVSVLQRADYPSSHHFKVVVDYSAHPSMNYQTVVDAHPADWAFITAFLPEVDIISMYNASQVAPNQIIWGPPTELNINTLWTSMNLVDVQLLLRPSDILALIPKLTLTALIGNTLPLARTTYVILPCDVEDEMKFIRSTIRWVMQQQYQLGCRYIEADVLPIVHLKSSSCRRYLMEVQVKALVKGTRHTWCYYTHGSRSSGAWTKFVLHYNATAPMQLRVQRDANATEAAGWTAAKVISDWLPNINLGDVLGWGLSAPQRLLLYWSMLRESYWPDYNTHNWVVTRGGQVWRIDKEIKSSKKHPPGLKYVKRLRTDTCLPSSLLPLEHTCTHCKSCIDHAEVSFRVKTRPLRECKGCLPCIMRSVFSWSPSEAYHYSTGTGSASLTRDTWARPLPCLTHVPMRELVNVKMCGLGKVRPVLGSNASEVLPPDALV